MAGPAKAAMTTEAATTIGDMAAAVATVAVMIVDRATDEAATAITSVTAIDDLTAIAAVSVAIAANSETPYDRRASRIRRNRDIILFIRRFGILLDENRPFDNAALDHHRRLLDDALYDARRRRRRRRVIFAQVSSER